MSPAPGLTAVSGGSEGKLYPSPVSSHQHVVGDSAAFWDSLRRFHFVMGSKFMIPVIGGKELNLHVLYVEVTKRGGYEKVVAEKKWREVGNVFNFSPTTTSASYVLRKHYSSLLYHYEQVYFFRAKGPLSTPSVAASPVSCRPEMGIVEYSTEKIRDCPHLPMEGSFTRSPLHLSFDALEACGTLERLFNDKLNYLRLVLSKGHAVGTIDGKFDCGYLVSVKLGSEILSGVLYHPEEAGRASTAVPQSSYAIVPYDAPKPTRSGRRRRNRRGRDPSYPKPNRSGYNFYFAEKHFKLKSLYPNREREFTKMIGESWSSLGPEERLVYQNIGLKDKERYKRELKEYKEKLKVNGGGGEH